jgi:hypothetical protein
VSMCSFFEAKVHDISLSFGGSDQISIVRDNSELMAIHYCSNAKVTLHRGCKI